MRRELTLEAMPQAILELIDKVENLQTDISELKEHYHPTTDEPMICIDEACKILHRAKSTVYALTQMHKIPYYQPGKMLQFKKSELMAWMESGRHNVTSKTQEQMLDDMQQGIHHKPKSNWRMK
ncbi:MAG: helix-turn-helix domain-containing protein [Prevotella sp.]|nr:helix-turn-helix domain-containing protein [Prevotella sp.]